MPMPKIMAFRTLKSFPGRCDLWPQKENWECLIALKPSDAVIWCRKCEVLDLFISIKQYLTIFNTIFHMSFSWNSWRFPGPFPTNDLCRAFAATSSLEVAKPRSRAAVTERAAGWGCMGDLVFWTRQERWWCVKSIYIYIYMGAVRKSR